MLEQAQRILKDVFGYDHFRGRQQAIIERVAGGEDALVLMPQAAASRCASRFRRCCATAWRWWCRP